MIGEAGRQDSASSRARRAPATILIVVLSMGLDLGGVEAQDRVADFSDKPILVLDTGGHHAPIRRLVFTRDESRLLSAGDDKVVRVWDLARKAPGPDWTIRPPIWRGRAGAIYGMALTAPDAQGRQTLALGGYGVESMRGEIGLYRFPGAADRRQGDVESYLASGDLVPLDQSKGHFNVVTGLAFSPDGTILASSSNDQTARLWDYRNHAQLGILFEEGQGKVNALAFTPDGRRLATGGSDGSLRVWDIATRRLVARAAPPVIRPDDREGLAINALVIDPEGRWVVVGREDGALIRYDLTARDLKASEMNFKVGPQQGPVEGLAFGTGGRLASSIIARGKLNRADRPTVACDIELRQVLDLATAVRLDTSTNLVYALEFSPRGSYLAFAGGDQQDLKLVDFRPESRGRLDLSSSAAKGRSIWDVGFVGNVSVAYSHDQPAAPRSVYYGFDLKDRMRVGFQSNQVRKAVKDFEGWVVTPVDTYQLEVSRGAARFPIRLAPDLDGRWWDYSFLPAGPKHDKPTLAIACERGVAVYRLEDGVRTRFLDGHNGSVYCLAPSPDGKWLATGSSDQTIRLWALAGCDAIASLGAEFGLNGGVLTVKSVERGGFADIAGMKAGDVLDEPGLEGRPVKLDTFLNGYAKVPPNSRVEYKGHRLKPDGGQEPVLAGTTKRDRPSLSLFVGMDREWVLWMPRGFYDSSVIGDSTFLGWQVNRYSKIRPSPTDFFPILTHEKALRQPKGVPGNAIDRLLDAADEAVVVGPAPAEQEAVVEADRPALVTPLLGVGSAPARGPDGRAIAAGAPLPALFSMPPGPLVLDWKLEPWDKKPPGPFEVRLEGETVRPSQPPPFDPALGIASAAMRYDLATPGTYLFTGVSDLGGNFERKTSITANVDGDPPKKPNRLRMLPIAPTFLDPKIRPIKAAQRDIADLSPFLAKHMVTEAGGPFGKLEPIERGLVGKDAEGAKVLAALDHLGSETVEAGDLVIVIVETYVLNFPRGRGMESRLIVSNSQLGEPMRGTTLPADEVGKALESLVRRGCKVILVLDGTHESPARGTESAATEWARSLRNQHDVITILATTRRPIADEFVGAHRPLSQAILDSIRSANPRPADPLMTYDDLRVAIIDRVQELTKRNGEPMVYLPRGFDSRSPILNRKP